MKIRKAEIMEAAKKLTEKFKSKKYAPILLICGLILILLPGGNRGEEDTQEAPREMYESTFTLEEEEKKLENMLSKISGAGDVEVMLTLKTGSEQILAQNEEQLSESGADGERREERNVSTVVLSKGGGGEDGITLKYIYPQYLGALVVAEGADSRQVQLALTEAVASLTGLSTDKITVTKMKNS